jgi:cyanophycinase-like exopeptidase
VGKPRLLTIMGSGETSPTMVTTHKDVLAQLDPEASVVMLTTPFAFQENCEDLADRARGYFANSVGRKVTCLDPTPPPGAEDLATARALRALADAAGVFSGPGSPTYALRRWRGTSVPRILADKLSEGGVIIFSSAAALTLGSYTVPVYEIYKCGQDPYLEPGLGLLETIGLRAAVVPHYDNAEGGNHDTRYCYLGPTRLNRVAEMLAGDAVILGVDEHSAVTFDLGSGTFKVTGRGGLTIRSSSGTRCYASGTVGSIDDLIGARLSPAAGPADDPGPATPKVGSVRSLGDLIATWEADAHALADAADGSGLARLAFEIHKALAEWSCDTDQNILMDQANELLGTVLATLADGVERANRLQTSLVEPLVETLIGEREDARTLRDFARADRLRDELARLGIQIQDGRGKTEWSIDASP